MRREEFPIKSQAVDTKHKYKFGTGKKGVQMNRIKFTAAYDASRLKAKNRLWLRRKADRTRCAEQTVGLLKYM